MKANDDEWVGCMPEQVTKGKKTSYQWLCRPNIECDQKLARLEVAEKPPGNQSYRRRKVS